jgi:2-isopropylmalate synthase
VRRLPISEQSGKATVVQHAATMGLTLDKNSKEVRAVLNTVTEQEAAGYAFEGAEASFELIVRKETGQYHKFFDLIGYRVLVEKRHSDQSPITEATLRVRVGDKEYLTVADGDGPVHALDGALRKALLDAYPQLSSISLTDFKVRVVTSGEGTAARVRAIIESTDHHGHSYNTVGVSTNIIEASWEALVDSVEYGLFGLGDV